MLLRRNIHTTRPSQKLDFRKLGPFKVAEKLSDNVYRLLLPSSMSRLHPTFNVNLLEPYTSPSDFDGRSLPSKSPTPVLEPDASPGIAIDAFLEIRRIGRRFDYLVDFVGQPESERAWIPLSDIPSTYNEKLEQFHRRNPRFVRPADSTLLRSRPLSLSKSPHAPIAPESDSVPVLVSVPVPVSDSFPSSSSALTPSASASDSTSVPILPATSSLPLSTPLRSSKDLRSISLKTLYTPPSATTTRSGRVSRPSDRDAITRAITN